MYVKASPSRGPTKDTGLGFDFDFGTFVNQVAPAALQIYGNKQQLDAARMQADMIKRQQMAQMQAQYAPQQAQPYYGGSRGSVGEGLPKWAIPAGIGAVGLLAVLMMRK